MQTDMTNQETIICENCGEAYPALDSQCPVCSEANPYTIAEFLGEALDEDFEDFEEFEEEEFRPRPWWRSPLGCISIILFLTFIIGGIALGGYEGLKERTSTRRAEVSRHYRQALEHIEKNEIDLAIAELGQTLTLNPAHTEARDLLRQLKSTRAEAPTPTSETRQNLAEEMFSEAKALALQGDWEGAIKELIQLRDIDSGYKPQLVAENLYSAYYELGLRLMTENKLADALNAFDSALVERPNDPLVTQEWEKVSLYLSLETANPNDYENNIVILNHLYESDPEFTDVKDRLFKAYKSYGDQLAGKDKWCQAYPRYQEALAISFNAELENLASDAQFRCESARQPTSMPKPTAAAVVVLPTKTATQTTALTKTTVITASSGNIYFSRLNKQNKLWEIIAVAPGASKEEVILSNGTQPAISPNGVLLVYRSEILDSRGLHIFNLNTGQDLRVTPFTEDILPNWGGGNKEFIFVSQRSGDRRWQIYLGFADGKGDAVTLHDGRTPDLSPNDNIIAYQGSDPQGNNPGIYTIPKGGGDAIRVTEHESDRSPAFSPHSDKIAFMTTRNGNWDIWLVAADGGKAAPLIASSANDGLPVWSPDGSQLAFVSDRDGSWGVYIVSSGGGNPQKAADWGGDHPDWLLEQLSWGR